MHACSQTCQHDETDSAKSLYRFIDTDRTICLNESIEGSGKTVIKPYDERFDTRLSVKSDVDEQLIFTIYFTGTVKLQTISIYSGNSCPSKCKLYINTEIDFTTDRQPTQELELANISTLVEYPVRAALFTNVQSLSIFFTDCFEGDVTQIYSLGFKGAYMENIIRKVSTVYEAQANISDHKQEIEEFTTSNLRF